MKTSRRPWLAVLITALLTACTASGGERSADPAPVGTETDIALPVDSYGYTAVEAGQIILAREMVTAGCLRRLRSPAVEEPDRAALDRVTQSRLRDLGLHGNNRRYGVTDPETSRTYGYHLPSTVDGPATAPNLDEKTSGPHSEPRRRCLDEAARAIAGAGPLGNGDIVRKIAWESYEHSLRSPAVTEALNRWASCMTARGHGHATPQAAESAFDLNTAVVTAEEIAVAVADVTCKREVRLVETWYDVEKDYQEAEIVEHAQELDAARAAHDQSMKRVNEVIA